MVKLVFYTIFYYFIHDWVQLNINFKDVCAYNYEEIDCIFLFFSGLRVRFLLLSYNRFYPPLILKDYCVGSVWFLPYMFYKTLQQDHFIWNFHYEKVLIMISVSFMHKALSEFLFLFLFLPLKSPFHLKNV